MNKDILAGSWDKISGKIKQQWGELTDDEITKINGKREELLGTLKQKYGYRKEEAEEELNKFLDKHKDEFE